MPRQLKPQKVETLNHAPSRRAVDLMLDRNTMKFFGMVGGDRVEGDTFAECRAAVWKRLEETKPDLDWIPVIQAYVGGSESSHVAHSRSRRQRTATLDVRVSRFYVARTGAGQWLEIDWDTKPEDRLHHAISNQYIEFVEGGEVVLPFHRAPRYAGNGEDAFFAYTDEMWAHLERMLEALGTLGKNIRALVADVQGFQAQALSGGSALALPSGAREG